MLLWIPLSLVAILIFMPFYYAIFLPRHVADARDEANRTSAPVVGYGCVD